MGLLFKLKSIYAASAHQMSVLLEPFALLFLRLLGAKVFLQSGLTKWDGFLQFNTEKYDLFLYEFFCPEEPRPGALLLCDAETLEYTEGSSIISVVESLAVMAGVMEVVLPVLLILGLFTRLSALGLLGMTLFIQIAIFPEWSHWWNPAVWWAVVMFTLVAKGPGLLSLDRIFKLEKPQ